ncbi:hypothetical protein FS837_000731 [Tulasnella sp. UAMH 9824]|nr:hypothetical protein FS837_000731 [Tulasnella sp. UAMH 9824]
MLFYNGSMPESAAFLDLVLPKLTRWEEATLYLPSEREDLSEILKSLEHPAPLLRKFHVDSRSLGVGSQVDLFKGHAPNLAELSIHNLRIRWSSSIFHDLLSISISGVMQRGPTVEEVSQWLASCPRLRSFRLSGFASSPINHHQDVPPIELPHLRSLDLGDLSSSSTELILSRIRAPALRDLFAMPSRPALVDGIHQQTLSSNAILHFSPAIRSSIGHARGLAISMHVSTGHISVSTTELLRTRNEGVTINFHTPLVS